MSIRKKYIDYSVTNYKEKCMPNSETKLAIKEADQMIQNQTGQNFIGSAKDFIIMLLKE